MAQTIHTVATILQYAIQVILLTWGLLTAWHGGESKALRSLQKRLSRLGLEGEIDQKAKKRIGKTVAILMAASLVVSIISDFSGARLGAIQDANLNSRIEQSSPKQQPIASLSATVRIVVLNTNTTNIDPVKNNNSVSLQFGRSDQTKSNLWKVKLICTAFTRYWNKDSAAYYLEFRMDPMSPLGNIGTTETVETVNEWDMVVFNARFLRSKSEILEGDVELTVNSTIRKGFSIPRQIATIVYGNPSVMPGTTSNTANVRVFPAPVE